MDDEAGGGRDHRWRSTPQRQHSKNYGTMQKFESEGNFDQAGRGRCHRRSSLPPSLSPPSSGKRTRRSSHSPHRSRASAAAAAMMPMTKEETKSLLKTALDRTRRGARWVGKDLAKRHLLWVKVIFLFQSASLVTLYPYLTLHLRSLGFDLSDAALVNAVVPVADVVAPPVAGIVADRIGNFGVFMAAVTFLNGAASLLLLAVPRLEAPRSASTAASEAVCCREDGLDDLECIVLSQLAFNESQIDQNGNLFCHRTTRHHNHNLSEVEGRSTLYFRKLRFRQSQVTYEHRRNNHNDSNNGSLSEFCPHLQCHHHSAEKEEGGGDGGWLKSMSIYLTVRVLLDVLRASSLMLFEGAVVAIIKEHGGDYGLQKLFGTAGAVAFGPLAGKLVDYTSNNGGINEYAPVIVLYFVLRTATAALILKLSLDFKPPAKKVFRQAGSVLARPRVAAFLAAFSLAGALWGFVETFLFWFLEDLGATKTLMGATLAVGTAAGVPIALFSRLLISKLGHPAVAVAALSLYSFRLLGLSLLPPSSTSSLSGPALSLPLELFKPACTTLLLIAAMGFVKDASPVTAVATVEGVFGASYFGAGRGVGAMVGAWLWEAVGARRTMQIFSVVGMGGALLYSLSQVACFRREEENAEEEAKDPEKR